jgi:diguanylate cyclase (GGDEF)-like protein/PAS domain S-box-containing protein
MELARLREVVASLYDDTPDAVVLYDLHGRIVAANESAQLMVGYAMAELEGQDYHVHIADEGERVELAIRTALAGGSDHFEAVARHKSGTTIPVECYVFPAVVAGETIGIFTQARDIVALKSAEESLGINQERFRSLFEYHPDGIMELRTDGSVSRVNVALENATGFYSEHVVGREWTDLIAPEYRAQAASALQAAIRGEAVEHDSMLLDRLGNRIDVQLKLVPLHVRGEIHGAYAIVKDIAAQKTAERAIATQSERVRRLYIVSAARGGSIDDHIDAMLALGLELFGFDIAYITQFDGDRAIVRNAVGSESSPIRKGVVVPMSHAMSRHLHDDRSMLVISDIDASEFRDDASRGTADWRSYFALRLSAGDVVYGALIFASSAPRLEEIAQRDRDLIQLMGLFVVGALERAEQSARIEQLAFNDALTGLPNRVLFDDRIQHTIATAKRYDRGFAVFYLDIDKFKEINDRYGHPVGDQVLVGVAKRLRAALRESDTVARFGGDEFVILQPIVDGPGDSADLARKIHTALQAPMVVDGIEHAVRASIGIAIYPHDATTIEGLMEAADRALYAAKGQGRNRWSFADQESARRGFKTPGVRPSAATRQEAAE